MNFFENKIHNENVKDFFGRYVKECYKLLNFVSNYYKLRAEKRNNLINSFVNEILPVKYQNLTLSQKSILLLNSIDGVSCVLVGMRKEKYVDDVLKILTSDKIVNAKEIIEYVSKEVELAYT